jgi:hypothetical protein
MTTVFSHPVFVAESVSSERENIMLYSIYTLILVEPAIVWSYLLAVASSLNRIYENSLDLVDLGKPKFP